MERFKGKEMRQALPPKQLDPARVEQIFTQRKEMLRSIEMDIGAAFYDAIGAKVDYENRFLLGIIESDAKMTETRKRLNRVIKAEYFVQKPLDVNIL